MHLFKCPECGYRNYITREDLEPGGRLNPDPRPLTIIQAAVQRVASWPEWKRKMFEAFSKRNSD
jgi:hypothetical protein